MVITKVQQLVMIRISECFGEIQAMIDNDSSKSFRDIGVV